MRLETVLKRIGNEMIRHLPIAAVALVVSLTASAQPQAEFRCPRGPLIFASKSDGRNREYPEVGGVRRTSVGSPHGGN